MMSAPSQSNDAAPRRRIVFAAIPNAVSLEPITRDGETDVWRVQLLGVGGTACLATLDRGDAWSFGAQLASLHAGARTSAEMVSRCGRVRLAAVVEHERFLLVFRMRALDSLAYTTGHTWLSENALERAAHALLAVHQRAAA